MFITRLSFWLQKICHLPFQKKIELNLWHLGKKFATYQRCTCSRAIYVNLLLKKKKNPFLKTHGIRQNSSKKVSKVKKKVSVAGISRILFTPRVVFTWKFKLQARIKKKNLQKNPAFEKTKKGASMSYNLFVTSKNESTKLKRWIKARESFKIPF